MVRVVGASYGNGKTSDRPDIAGQRKRGMEILKNWRDIAAAFSVRVDVVKEWHKAGAPIVVLPGGRMHPCASLPDLWAWLLQTYRRSPEAPKEAKKLRTPGGKAKPAGGEESGEEPGASARPDVCPKCGTRGSLYRHRGGWRCDWCGEAGS